MSFQLRKLKKHLADDLNAQRIHVDVFIYGIVPTFPSSVLEVLGENMMWTDAQFQSWEMYKTLVYELPFFSFQTTGFYKDSEFRHFNGRHKHGEFPAFYAKNVEKPLGINHLLAKFFQPQTYVPAQLSKVKQLENGAWALFFKDGQIISCSKLIWNTNLEFLFKLAEGITFSPELLRIAETQDLINTVNIVWTLSSHDVNLSTQFAFAPFYNGKDDSYFLMEVRKNEDSCTVHLSFLLTNEEVIQDEIVAQKILQAKKQTAKLLTISMTRIESEKIHLLKSLSSAENPSLEVSVVKGASELICYEPFLYSANDQACL
jgi:hypothetical protein